LTLRHAGAVFGSAVLVFGLFGWGLQKALLVPSWQLQSSIVGAVVDGDQDVRKQRPLANVHVVAGNRSFQTRTDSDVSGLFSLTVPIHRRLGGSLVLTFTHPDYKPVQMTVVPTDKLLVIRMNHLHPQEPAAIKATATKVGDVRIRYSVRTGNTLEVGTAITTLEVQNQGNRPCNNQPPCSPDNRWKASIGSAKLTAPQGNEIRNARISCIAGPCPFTKIEASRLSPNRQQLDVTARNWSDTATFLIEADIVENVVSDMVRTSAPIIFGRALNFTLPSTATGPSLQAAMNGTEIVFPLGPQLHLSWAECTVKTDVDQSKLYSCELKPGYAFQ
jgi:hypothetical protein